MTPPVFVAETSALAGDTVVLDGPEGRHAATVRRLRVGERLDLTDGVGRVAVCVVASVARDSLTVSVLARREVPRPAPRLVVVQALAKGGRDEDAVEVMTEVGVDEIVPWSAARSVARWEGSRGERSLERWRSIAREASKQSRRTWFPSVSALASTDDVRARLSSAAAAVVLHESATQPLTGLALPAAGDVLLVVGPEGGITDDELSAFAGAGAAACRLGPTVLRTSTAGVAAAALVLARTARW